MACISGQGLVRSLERSQKMVQSPLEQMAGIVRVLGSMGRVRLACLGGRENDA